jgi:hypothetical protein
MSALNHPGRGCPGTVKFNELLFTPFMTTTTGPEVAALGTVAAICVLFQLVMVALVPLNLTEPLPCVAPKFDPLIVTDAEEGAIDGDKLVIVAGGPSKKTPLTTAFPEPVFVTTMET